MTSPGEVDLVPAPDDVTLCTVATRPVATFTLADGRVVSATLDDAQLERLEVDRVARWEAAIGRGETIDLGAYALSPTGLRVGALALPWRAVTAAVVHDGRLHIQASGGTRGVDLALATTPWAGALARVIRARVRPAARRQPIVLAACLALAVAGVAAVWIVDARDAERRLHTFWRHDLDLWVADWILQLDPETFASLPPCAPLAREEAPRAVFGVRSLGAPTASDGPIELTRDGEVVGELFEFPSNVIVWTRDAGRVRGAYVHERWRGGAAPCAVTAPGADVGGLLRQLRAGAP